MNRQRVLLVGMARSGTTFLGELFRRHPECEYLFEPCARTRLAAAEYCWRTEADSHPDDEKLLRQVFGGRVGELATADPELAPWLERHGWRADQESSPLLAVKEIKLNLHLRWAACVLGENLRIVHLVRDPRGIADSFLCTDGGASGARRASPRSLLARAKPTVPLHDHWGWSRSPTAVRLAPAYAAWWNDLGHPDPLVDVAARWCVTVGHALDDAATLREGTHYRIRYEDLCRDPQGEAEALYRFLGWELPSVVSAWIAANTSAGDRSDRYGTSRNSRQMADVWRNRLPPDDVARIESLCGPLMDRLGYERSARLARSPSALPADVT